MSDREWSVFEVKLLSVLVESCMRQLLMLSEDWSLAEDQRRQYRERLDAEQRILGNGKT